MLSLQVVLTFARAVEAGMDAETSDMNSGNTVCEQSKMSITNSF